MGAFDQHRHIAELKPVTDDYTKAHAAVLAAKLSIVHGALQVPETTRRPSWLRLSRWSLSISTAAKANRPMGVVQDSADRGG
jgi:hypothetical protein